MLDLYWSCRGAIVALVMAVALWTAVAVQAQSNGTATAADESSEQPLQEVVVTAERRSSKLQETPLAVSPVSGIELEQRNIQTMQDLASTTPTLDLGISLGQAHPAIRGIGASDIIFGADPRVGFYLDDVYLARPEEQLGVLYDINQVQVLNGPQGTLYGRNATAGALLVSSNRPTQTPTGYIDVTAGNYDEVDTIGAVSGPLTETLSARLAFQTLDHAGYGRNVITGNDVDDAHQRSARLSFLWEPTNDFNFLLQTDYHRERDHDYTSHFGGLGSLSTPPVQPTGVLLGGFVLPPNSRDVTNTVDPFNDRLIWGTAGTATWTLGSLTLKSITGYRFADLALGSEIDPSSLSLLPLTRQVQTSRQVSEELQALVDTGPNHLVAGFSYFDEHISGMTPVGVNLLVIGGPNFLSEGVDQAGDETTESAALYARDTYDFTDQLSAILGGRYTYEKKNVFNEFGESFSEPYSSNNPIPNIPPFPYNAEKAYNAFTPSGTLDYKFTPRVFGYATITEGYKSGGFNIGAFQPAFQPEKIWDYELGLKTTSLDNRLQADFSAFYYNYSNLQVSIVNGTQVLIENAAKAALYGGEAELIGRPWNTLQLELAFSALHAEYQDYMSTDPANPQLGIQNLSGNQLTQAPKFKVNAAAQYAWHIPTGRITLRGEYTWVDDIFFTPFDTRTAWSPQHSLSNLFLNYEMKNWTAKVYVRNLINKTIVTDAYTATALVGYAENVTLAPPRTYGVTIGYRF